MFNRYIVFTVPVRERLDGSILLTTKPWTNAYSRAEEAWIVSAGPESKLNLSRGTKCYLVDSFELEPTKLNLWDELKNDKEFESLLQFVNQVSGTVVTSVISENSLIAVELDDGGELHGGIDTGV